MAVTLLIHVGTGTIIDADDDVRVLVVEDGDTFEDDNDIVTFALEHGTVLRLADTQCPDCSLVGGDHVFNCQLNWTD